MASTRKLIRITFYLSICFFLTSRGSAWNAEGHMVIGQIAYNHFDTAVKAKCDALIAIPLTYGDEGNSNFVTASCWADDHRTQLGTANWHFINLPFSLDGTTTNNFVIPTTNVVTAIRSCIATMQNPTASQADQAASLRYVIHFVGDMHQPLHCTTAMSSSTPNGDAGGNGFPVGNGWGNLHSLWDSGGGYLNDTIFRPLTGIGQSIINGKVAAVESTHSFIANVGLIPEPMDWAYEGLGLCKTNAYVGITRNGTPSANYLNTTQNATAERLAKAGHRLANLLNTIYSSTPFVLTSLPTPNGNVRFSWDAIPGRTYRVQWKQQLDGATWNDFADVIASTNSVSFTNAVGQTQRFYRVKSLH